MVALAFALQLVLQFQVFLFQCHEALEFMPVGRSHQVRQHVHLAKGHLPQRKAGALVREQGPVGARDLALLPGLLPRGLQCSLVLGGGKALDHGGMALVQRLVDGLGQVAVLMRQAHGLVMQFQIGLALDIHVPAQQLAQLGRAQAGSYHRAVQMRVQLVQPGARMGGRRAAMFFVDMVVPAALAVPGLQRAGRHGGAQGGHAACAEFEGGRQHRKASHGWAVQFAIYAET